jgi:hypothetical protein
MNARKLSRYLGELESIYQQSVNLTINYDNAMNLIGHSRNDNREIGLDRNYINITESQIVLNHQQLMLNLQGLRAQLNQYNNRMLTDKDHMPMLVLGEQLSNWSDQYSALIVAPAMNVASHIQDTYILLNHNQSIGVAHV